MTFWEKFYDLCLTHNTKPNPVAKELGFSSATCTQWKKGSIPSSKTISKISEYFGVSADYLTNGVSTQTGSNVQNNINGDNNITITSSEDEQILALLKQMDIVQRSKAIIAINDIIKEDRNG